jgi:hypothetical protein
MMARSSLSSTPPESNVPVAESKTHGSVNFVFVRLPARRLSPTARSILPGRVLATCFERMGAMGDDVLQPQSVQHGGELTALALHTVRQHDREPE